jgi:O-antigen/teichoic acid export membrane protein
MDSTPTFKRTFLKHLLTLGSYHYSSEVVTFLSSVILARLLVPEEYGFVAMITVFTNFALIFAGAGLDADIIRSDYRDTYHKGLLTLALYIGIGLFLFMSLLSYPIALFYSNIDLIFPIIVMSLQFLVRGVIITLHALLMKEMRFNYIGKVTFYSTLLNITLMIVMAFAGCSFWSLIIPILIMNIVQYIFFSIGTGFKVKFYSLAHVVASYRKAKSMIWTIIGFNIIDYWAKNLDKLLAGKFYGDAAIGLYNKGFRFLFLSQKLITGIFGAVIYPSLKKIDNNPSKVLDEYFGLLGIISLINFPLGAILILLPNSIVLILWGKSWLGVAPFLPFFGVIILSQTIIATNDSMFKLFNKEKAMFYLGAVSSGILVVAIGFGAFQSLLSIAKYYALAYVVGVIPLQLYLGFIRIIGYSTRSVLVFWGPKMICYLSILYGIWNSEQIFTFVGVGLYFIHLIYSQRNDISQVFKKVSDMIKI